MNSRIHPVIGRTRARRCEAHYCSGLPPPKERLPSRASVVIGSKSTTSYTARGGNDSDPCAEELYTWEVGTHLALFRWNGCWPEIVVLAQLMCHPSFAYPITLSERPPPRAARFSPFRPVFHCSALFFHCFPSRSQCGPSGGQRKNNVKPAWRLDWNGGRTEGGRRLAGFAKRNRICEFMRLCS